jgi:hypothetical protein
MLLQAGETGIADQGSCILFDASHLDPDGKDVLFAGGQSSISSAWPDREDRIMIESM